MGGFIKKTQRFWTFITEFMFYCFCGWVYEGLCGLVINKSFENRSPIHLPVLFIYGCFACVVLLIFKHKKHKPAFVFFTSFIVITAGEYIVSVISEKLLQRRFWDYSLWIFEFQGRVSLISSMIFATACVLLVFWVHPVITDFFNKKSRTVPAFLLGAAMLAAACADVGYCIALR